jgi:hypothetical protein
MRTTTLQHSLISTTNSTTALRGQVNRESILSISEASTGDQRLSGKPPPALVVRLRPVMRHTLGVAIIAICLLMFACGTTYDHPGAPVAPHDLWSAWTWDPLVLFFLIVGVRLYVQGTRRLRRRWSTRRHELRWRTASFLGGVAALFIAQISPLDAASSSLFSAHMLQHLVLVVAAAPLLALSSPRIPILVALPAQLRRFAGRSVRPLRPFRIPVRWMTGLTGSWMLHTLALWLWHIPRCTNRRWVTCCCTQWNTSASWEPPTCFGAQLCPDRAPVVESGPRHSWRVPHGQTKHVAGHTHDVFGHTLVRPVRSNCAALGAHTDRGPAIGRSPHVDSGRCCVSGGRARADRGLDRTY